MLGSLAHSLAAELKHRLLHRFTTHSTEEFKKFTDAPLGAGGPLVRPAAHMPEGGVYLGGATFRGMALRSEDPRHCEELFASLQQQKRYEEMWSLLAPEAQASWGNREAFLENQIRQDRVRLVGHQVDRVQILPEWTDERRRKTYRNVAELKVRYHVKVDWRDLALERDVHLVHVDGTWKTLCYAD